MSVIVTGIKESANVVDRNGEVIRHSDKRAITVLLPGNRCCSVGVKDAMAKIVRRMVWVTACSKSE